MRAQLEYADGRYLFIHVDDPPPAEFRRHDAEGFAHAGPTLRVREWRFRHVEVLGGPKGRPIPRDWLGERCAVYDEVVTGENESEETKR